LCIYDFNSPIELQDIEKLYIYTDEIQPDTMLADGTQARHLKNLIEFEIFGFQFDSLELLVKLSLKT
jgi:hypothetical protein